MEFVTAVIADWLMLPLMGLAGYALLFLAPRQGWLMQMRRVFMAGLMAYVAAKLVALVFQPATLRPFELLGVAPGAAYLNNPGFPSDHALFAMFLTLAVWFSTRHRVVSGVMLALTLAVCIGRVMALVHTPLDVAGGLVIACVGAVWYRVPSSPVAGGGRRN